jgi:hypothetical protein
MPRVAPLQSLAVCLIAGAVLLPNLGGYPLLDPDEGRHAAIAREMLGASSWRGWVVPTLGGEPYYDKPVLFYWLTAAAYGVVGVGELGARLVSTLSALGTIVLVWRLGATAWGTAAGVAAAIVCVTMTGVAGVARLATLDMLLTFWITASIAAVLHWQRTGRSQAIHLAAAAAACGTLTKGLVAPLVVAPFAAALAFDPATRRHLRPSSLVTGAVTYLAVAGPWHLAAGAIDPAYLPALYLRHHLARAAGTFAQSHVEPAYYYVPVLALALLPWTVLLPAAVVTNLQRAQRDPLARACVAWAAVVVLLFSLSSTKLATYVLPALPPLALLIGRHVALAFVEPAMTTRPRRFVQVGLITAALACLIAPLPTHLTAVRAYGGAFAALGGLGWVLVPFGVALGWVVVRDRLAWGSVLLALVAVTFALVLFGRVAPVLAPARSTKPLADAIARAGLPADTPIIGFGTRAPSLLFYTDLRPVLTTRLRDVRTLRAAHPFVLVMTTPAHLPRLESTGPWHPWVTGPRILLYGSAPPPPSPIQPRGGAGGNTGPRRL